MNNYIIHFNFFFLIDINIENNAVILGGIVALNNIYFSIQKSFCEENIFNSTFGIVYLVIGYLATFQQQYFFGDIILFWFWNTEKIDIRESRALLEVDFQPDIISFDFLCSNFHIGKQSLLPKFFNGICNGFARNFHFLSDG